MMLQNSQINLMVIVHRISIESVINKFISPDEVKGTDAHVKEGADYEENKKCGVNLENFVRGDETQSQQSHIFNHIQPKI